MIVDEDLPGGSYIISDDAYMSLTSTKITLQGIYGGDIVIPQDGAQVAQLVFFLHIFWSARKPIHKIGVRIKFPNNDLPYSVDLPENPVQAHENDRSRRNVRFPFPVMAPVLHSGKIEILVVHDQGDFALHPTWIVTPAANKQRAITFATSSPPPPSRSPPAAPAS